MTTKQIERELLRLDVRSRAKLAKKMLRSLDELSESENEQVWAEEALRRHQEILSGKAKVRSARVVFRNARARIK